MGKETNRVLGHADEADGIEEYDNPLPDWWLGLFFFTIVWAIGYGVDYHFLSQKSQASLYLAEMEEAEKRWPVSDTPSEVAMTPEAIEAGGQVYTQTCASCHGPELGGGIGPNLTDAEWIHGGEPAQVVATITEGVSAKGMPAWGPILGPAKVQQVAAFVLSKKGSAPADPAPGAEEAPAVADAAAADAPLDGKAIYDQNCLACHGANLEGVVGPSLVDAEWIHGGELEQITKTITEGVPEKGMIQWGPVLGPEKIAAVAQFVHDKANEAP